MKKTPSASSSEKTPALGVKPAAPVVKAKPAKAEDKSAAPAPAVKAEGKAAAPAPAAKAKPAKAEGKSPAPAQAVKAEGKAVAPAPAAKAKPAKVEDKSATPAPAAKTESKSAAPAPAAKTEGKTVAPAPIAKAEGKPVAPTPAAKAEDKPAAPAAKVEPAEVVQVEPEAQGPLPEVSVVIPVYGSENYIEQAIRSVSDHTSCSFEIIAINDESPDDALSVLHRLAQEIPQLRVYSQKNMGGSATLNRGMDLARGEHLMFLDGDDWIPPHAIDILLERIQTDDSDIAFGIIEKYVDGETSVCYDTKLIFSSLVIGPKNKFKDHPVLLENSFYSGTLFKTSLLRDKQIRFSETLLYADRPFVMMSRACAKRISITPHTTAFWRKRSDEDNPSITDQRYELSVFEDKVASYQASYDMLRLGGQKEAAEHTAETNTRRLFWNITPMLSQEYIAGVSDIIKPYLWAIGDHNRFASLSGYQKLVLDHIAYYPSEYIYYYIRALDVAVANTKRLAPAERMAAFRAVKCLGERKAPNAPVACKKDPEIVVFEANFGKCYGGNPRYVYEELKRSGRRFKPVWVYEGGGAPFPYLKTDVLQVSRGSPAYFSYLSRAKYWVNNIRFQNLNKPEGTTYLQTWHGTPLKKLGLDIEVDAGPELDARDAFLTQVRTWDYLISQNAYSSEIFRRAFGFQNELLEVGYPANDALKSPRIERIAEAMREKHNLPTNRKIVMYAPTWRDYEKKGPGWSFNFRLQLDLHRLRKHLGGTHFFVIRLHHLNRAALPDNVFASLKDFVFDATKVADTHRLLAATDILITDYSSILYDFAVTGRPMIFYMYDEERYATKTRGFYVKPGKELPGPIVRDEGELVAALLKAGDEPSEAQAKKYAAFRRTYNKLDKGKSSKRVVDAVFSELKKG